MLREVKWRSGREGIPSSVIILWGRVGVASHRHVRETRHASGCSLTLGFEAVV